MSSIGVGVGLISGLDYQSIVDQLIAIDGAPRDLLVARMGNIDAQSTAYLDISARITALLTRINVLGSADSFRASTATSSLPDVLAASSSTGATPGTYNFVVRALAATHQAVSRGFVDRATPVGAGSLTIESAAARVDISTKLDELNGYAGVQRGAFKITDADGNEAEINLADALTLGEVLDKINEAGIAVEATVRDSRIVLTDTSDGGTGRIRIEELGGQAAVGLGFGPGYLYDTDGDGELAGTNLMYLSASSPLTALNDGLGLRSSIAGGDFSIKIGQTDIDVDLSEALKPSTRLDRLNHGEGVRLGTVKITSRDGTQATVDLSNARTIEDVQNALRGAFDDERISVVLSGSRLVVTDSAEPPSEEQTYDFSIVDIDGHSASDLGIERAVTTNKVDGHDILHMDTLGDVLTAINFAAGNEGSDKEPLVVASLRADGQGIVLEGRGDGAIMITAGTSTRSHALADLGLAEGTYVDIGGGAYAEGNRIVGGLDTVLLKTLNGGAGFTGGTIRIDGGGGAVDVDLSAAETLSDVVNLIGDAVQNAGLTLDVGYDSTGTRIELYNLDDGESPITISDVDGDFAEATGLAQTAGRVRSDNLQRRYVNENTQLSDLNGGRGIALGKFTVTNSQGVSKTIDLSIGSIETVQDVINEFTALNIGVTARVNDTGDGLLIVDENGGGGSLTIEDEAGSTASDLNIAGAADADTIDGSLEFTIEISGSDTLETLAERIGEETTLATGTLLNDGTGVAPYRLSISSRVSGSAGELIIDGFDSNLGISTLTRAQDARILYGSSATSGVLLTSASNTFDSVIDGLTLNATSVSDEVVSVTIDQDIDTLVETMQGLVEDYNSVIDRIDELTAYDEETETAAILLGDTTMQIIESRLFRMFSGSTTASGQYNRLSEVGLKYTTGTKLTFDEEKFRAAYAANPDAVTDYFTNEEYGVAHAIEEELKRITDSDGLIDRETNTLGKQKDLLQDRVDNMNELLESKRARLMAQFQAMESALALMQSQQSALSTLASLVPSTGTASLI